MADTARLLKLAEFLETRVPEESFNMSHWERHEYKPPTEGVNAVPQDLPEGVSPIRAATNL